MEPGGESNFKGYVPCGFATSPPAERLMTLLTRPGLLAPAAALRLSLP